MAIGKWIPFQSQQQQQATASNPQDDKPQPPPVPSSADAKLFGFENFGNTCYCNSVLQSLYFCAPFRELLLQSVDNSVQDEAFLNHPPPQPWPNSPSTAARRRPERNLSVPGHPPDLSLPPSAQQPSSASSSSSANPNGTAGPNAAGNGSASLSTLIPAHPPTLLSAMRSLFLFISKNSQVKGTLAPRAFIEKLKECNEIFRSTMHQDAHEFLNYTLNQVVEEIGQDRKTAGSGTPVGEDLSNSVVTLSSTGTSPQTATFVHKVFEGVLTSETRCLTCETVSSRDESFLDLSIDIEQNSSITSCLRQFSASEMLCHRNKFFCDGCCDLQEAEKRMKIKKLPNVLALHLKRFKYQEELQKYIKLTYRVAFPFELRLFNTVDESDDADRLYELFSIVVHIGNGPHHGHYIAIVRTVNGWMVFDDDSVEPIKESEITKYFGESNSGSAYVLYYQAVNIDLAALGLRSAQAIREPVSVPSPPAASSTPPPPPPLVPPMAAPSHPPGLVRSEEGEGDSSDISDPPFPVTPLMAPHHSLVVGDRLMKGKEKERVDVVDEGVGEQARAGGFMQSIRRAPPGKDRVGGTVGPAHQRNNTASISRPEDGGPLSLPPPLVNGDVELKVLQKEVDIGNGDNHLVIEPPASNPDATPSAPTPSAHARPKAAPMGATGPATAIRTSMTAASLGLPASRKKEKEKDRKSSGWFKRKSTKGKSDDVPPSPAPRGAEGGVVAWFKGEKTSGDSRDSAGAAKGGKGRINGSKGSTGERTDAGTGSSGDRVGDSVVRTGGVRDSVVRAGDGAEYDSVNESAHSSSLGHGASPVPIPSSSTSPEQILASAPLVSSPMAIPSAKRQNGSTGGTLASVRSFPDLLKASGGRRSLDVPRSLPPLSSATGGGAQPESPSIDKLLSRASPRSALSSEQATARRTTTVSEGPGPGAHAHTDTPALANGPSLKAKMNDVRSAVMQNGALPSASASSHTHTRSKSNGHSLDIARLKLGARGARGFNPDESPLSVGTPAMAATTLAASSPVRNGHAQGDGLELEFDTLGGTNSGSTTTSGSGSNAASGLKKASRKLSMVSPMLGLGRRDKDKDKEKDKTKKDKAGAPSAFSFAMGGRA